MTRVVGIGAVPMAVPHTRPIAITPHANRPELLTGESPWRGELRIPSSAQALLEVRLGEWGHDALGFVAHIPHYLAQLDYPQAALVAARAASSAAAGSPSTSPALRARGGGPRRPRSPRYLADNDEVGDGRGRARAAVRRVPARPRRPGRACSPRDEPLPTGEEIGQQFEQFLAGLDQPDADDRED